MNKKDIRLGLKMGISVALGYAPIAITFGMVAKSTGITLLEAFSFSAFVYAGASQFMALNLLILGTGFTEIIIATFLLNLRHFLMSASLSPRISKGSSKWFPLIASGVTDEVFALVSIQRNNISKEFFLSIHFMAYSSWIGSTLIGYLLGELLPKNLSDGMVMGLYAMFAAILIPQMKNSWRVAIIAIFAGIINTLVKNINFIPSSWSIIIAILLASFLGVIITSEEEVIPDEN